MGQFIILIFFIASSLTYLKAHPLDQIMNMHDTREQCMNEFDGLSGLSKSMCVADCVFKVKNMVNSDGSLNVNNFYFENGSLCELLPKCNYKDFKSEYMKLINLNLNSTNDLGECDPTPLLLTIVQCIEGEIGSQYAQ